MSWKNVTITAAKSSVPATGMEDHAIDRLGDAARPRPARQHARQDRVGPRRRGPRRSPAAESAGGSSSPAAPSRPRSASMPRPLWPTTPITGMPSARSRRGRSSTPPRACSSSVMVSTRQVGVSLAQHLGEHEQRALERAGVGDHDERVRGLGDLAVEDAVDDLLVGADRVQAVGAGQVDDDDVPLVEDGPPLAALDGDAGVVADLRPHAGEGVEERRLAGVGRADETQAQRRGEGRLAHTGLTRTRSASVRRRHRWVPRRSVDHRVAERGALEHADFACRGRSRDRAAAALPRLAAVDVEDHRDAARVEGGQRDAAFDAAVGVRGRGGSLSAPMRVAPMASGHSIAN